MAAADELQRAGVEVEVFEARDRVGGRVWSVPFAGATAERGAEFILPHDTDLPEMAQRLGLSLVRKGTLYGNREPRGGEAVSREQIVSAMEELRALRPIEGETVNGALTRARIFGGVAHAIVSRLEVSCAHAVDDLDASVLRDGAGAFGDFDSHTIDGGNDRLAREVASTLGEHTVHLGRPVRSINWSAGGVRVITDSGEAHGDAAVIAVPASVIGEIEFDPPLPPEKIVANSAVRYGQAAKLFVALRAPAPPSQTLSVPGRWWCYTQLGADGEPLPFVAAFACSAPAIDALELDAGAGQWVGALQELRPDLDLDPDGAMLSTWHDDPWVRGAYSARSPSSSLGTPELVQAVGPLAFAGEHTAGAWHGLMEGALRSGRRAAAELLQT